MSFKPSESQNKPSFSHSSDLALHPIASDINVIRIRQLSLKMLLASRWKLLIHYCLQVYDLMRRFIFKGKSFGLWLACLLLT